ncbi:uncharacterized protein RBU33_027753 [Hipposideros larvatus]
MLLASSWIMEETNMQIVWPSKLKIRARSKKDECMIKASDTIYLSAFATPVPGNECIQRIVIFKGKMNCKIFYSVLWEKKTDSLASLGLFSQEAKRHLMETPPKETLHEKALPEEVPLTNIQSKDRSKTLHPPLHPELALGDAPANKPTYLGLHT